MEQEEVVGGAEATGRRSPSHLCSRRKASSLHSVNFSSPFFSPHLLLFRRHRVWASYFISPSLFAGEGDTHIVFPPTNQPLSCFFVWYGSTISALLSRVSLSLFCGKRRAGGGRASSVVFSLFRLLTWKSLIPPSPREKEATGGGTNPPFPPPSSWQRIPGRQKKKPEDEDTISQVFLSFSVNFLAHEFERGMEKRRKKKISFSFP